MPGGFTVEGGYGVNRAANKKMIAVGAASQQDRVRLGYSKVHLHPVSDADLPAGGGMGDRWIVAKIVPTRPDRQTIEGIRVSYTSGLGSGSAVYHQQVTTDCAT